MANQSPSEALGEVQPTGSVWQPHTLQVKDDEHDAFDTAIYSPLGEEDKLAGDTLFTTVDSLFDQQTAEDSGTADNGHPVSI